jgi:hypothetical protein
MADITGREAEFVPERACGTCTVCCYALPIDNEELQKLPGEVCANCNGRGCVIYETRPRTCREFYCGWWVLPQLGDDWRPDRSGVLITPHNEDIPERFVLRQGIEFMILAGEDAVRRPGFAQTVLSFVKREIATFLAIPGPAGYLATRVLVNDALKANAASNDMQGALATLLRILDASRFHRFEKATLKHARSG